MNDFLNDVFDPLSEGLGVNFSEEILEMELEVVEVLNPGKLIPSCAPCMIVPNCTVIYQQEQEGMEEEQDEEVFILQVLQPPPMSRIDLFNYMNYASRAQWPAVNNHYDYRIPSNSYFPNAQHYQFPQPWMNAIRFKPNTMLKPFMRLNTNSSLRKPIKRNNKALAKPRKTVPKQMRKTKNLKLSNVPEA